MDIQIIKSPSKGTLKMLKRRSFQNDFSKDIMCDAVGLVQGKLSEMFVASDIAEKAADVLVEEIMGVCPQHFTLIAIFGDTASVTVALAAISKTFKEKAKVVD
jgi:ethanolamine utilization microcompartment shell protein EutS